MKAWSGWIVAVALGFAQIPAHAASHQAHHPADGKAAAGYVRGEVRKVDKEAGKITLRHDAIPSLDMPAMSMVFRVKEPGMLDRVKAGDVVRFKAEKIQGAYTVVDMSKAQ